MKIQPFKSGPRALAFTLIEIMVVVVILGILAAMIIPQFMGTTFDAKVSAAKGTVAELENAVDRFYVHMDRYPTPEEGLKVLVEPPNDDPDKKNGAGLTLNNFATTHGPIPINTVFLEPVIQPVSTSGRAARTARMAAKARARTSGIGKPCGKDQHTGTARAHGAGSH